MVTGNTLVQGIPVGRFEVIREIGRGGIAVVYLARQAGLDRQVALKELSAVHARDPAFAERFLREARIAGSLNHPNIVSVLDYFEIDGVPYIAMEYLPNGSLRRYMRNLSVAQIAGVLDALLAALAFAGERGVVHRDIKPENLLFGMDGVVKVADFGVAKALHSASDHNATVTGMTMGTPAYMAPEQAIGRNVGAAADVYGAGVLAYELLVGRTPFEDAESPVAMLYRHVHDAPPPPSAIRPDLDPRLEAWLLRLLAKDPDERPLPDAAREQLEEIVLADIGPRWRRETAIAPLMGSFAPELDAAGHDAPDTPPAGKPSADDGFRTFAPRLRRTRRGGPPPAHPPVPEAPAESLSGRAAPDAEAARLDANGIVDETMPALRTIPAPDASAPSRPRRRRALAIVVAGGTLLLGLVGGAVALMTGGNGPGQPTLPADEIPTLTSGLTATKGGLVLSEPDGHVRRLSRPNLSVTATIGEPLVPRSATAGRAGVYVVDSEGVTLRDAATLTPRWSVATGAQTMLVETPTGPVVAFQEGAANGRLCGVTPTGALQPCVVLGFAASGLGVAGSSVVVADPGDQQVVMYAAGRSSLTRTGAIPVGVQPHGELAGNDAGDRVYVPIERGLAVVDTAAGRLASTIQLETTPSDVAISRRTGAVLVALPGSRRVAIIDPLQSVPVPRLVDIGGPPVTLAADPAGDAVFAVSDGARAIAAIDPVSGQLIQKAPLPPFASIASPAVLTTRRISRQGRVVRLTLGLTARLDPAGFRVTRTKINRGVWTFELWQGGISSTLTPGGGGGLLVTTAQRPGRLVVTVRSAPRRFSSFDLHLAPSGRAVIGTFTQPPPRIAPPSGGSGPAAGANQARGSGGSVRGNGGPPRGGGGKSGGTGSGGGAITPE